MKVFICHHKPLKKRKPHMVNQLYIVGLNDFKFIECNDPYSLSQNDMDKFLSISNSEISIFLKHIECLRQISEGCEEAVMILEDDVVFMENFRNAFDKILSETPNDYDIIHFGSSNNLHILDLEDDKYVYKKNNSLKNSNDCEGTQAYGSSRGSDSYFIKKETARNIYEKFCNEKNYIKVPFWIWLSKICYSSELNVYWTEPNLTYAGSQSGLFESSI